MNLHRKKTVAAVDSSAVDDATKSGRPSGDSVLRHEF